MRGRSTADWPAVQALGRKVMQGRRQDGIEYARHWRAERRFISPATAPKQPRFPYPGHRHCGEWR
jgi:hypothetical protein